MADPTTIRDPDPYPRLRPWSPFAYDPEGSLDDLLPYVPPFGGAMPQSEEERRHHDPKTVLPYLAWYLPPVNAYLGGQRLAEGFDKGNLVETALGAAQVGLSVPGVWNAATSTLPSVVPGRRMPAAPSAASPRSGPTQGQRDLYAMREPDPREYGFGPNWQPGPDAHRYWRAQRELDALEPPPAPGPGQLERAREAFGALRPEQAFPRREGLNAVDVRNAYLALRQADGNIDDAIAFLNGNFPGAESVLRSWASSGVDVGRATQFWRGLRALDELEPPPPGRMHADGGAVGRALTVARKCADGGRTDAGAVTGPVVGHTGGREDAIPVSVPAGSYVIPADVVAACGDGNTLAGMKALEKMLGGSVEPRRAEGGAVPIRISDGEFVVAPEQVMKLGGGDMDQGHRVLDKFVKARRAAHIRHLKSLPGPVKG